MLAEMLLGASLVASGWVAGLGTSLLMRRKQPQAGPICPCSHSIGHHEDQTGRCLGQIRRVHYYDSGDRNGKEWVSCDCRRYSGPELLSSVTFRELEQP